MAAVSPLTAKGGNVVNSRNTVEVPILLTEALDLLETQGTVFQGSQTYSINL